MTPQEMAIEAARVLEAGQRLFLEREYGKKPPKGFPRGKLHCVNPYNGMSAYSYDPRRVLAWLNANRLIAVELVNAGDDLT